MARQLRIEYEDAFYHVISRGVRRDKIFINDNDKSKFLEKLREAIDKFNLKIHSYVLMNNHYHLLKETPDGNLSKAMHFINTSYAIWFKSKHQIVGPVFQGRYKSILVEKEAYFLTLSAYIHLNPVRAEIVNEPNKYRWSSFNDYLRTEKSNPWIFTEDILKMFAGDREAYKTFVYNCMKAGNEIRKEDINGKYGILGSEDFRDMTTKKFGTSAEQKDLREKPDLKHLTRLTRENIKDIILETFHAKEKELMTKKKGNIIRKIYAYGLKKYTDLSLRDMADMMDMDYAAVSQMVRRFTADLEKKDNLGSMVMKFEEEVKNFKTRNVKC